MVASFQEFAWRPEENHEKSSSGQLIFRPVIWTRGFLNIKFSQHTHTIYVLCFSDNWSFTARDIGNKSGGGGERGESTEIK